MKLGPAARADVKEITRFSTNRWGEDRAARYIAELRSRVAALSETAERGKPLDELDPPWLSVRSGRHLVIYRATQDAVFVVRVLHDRMEAKRRLP